MRKQRSRLNEAPKAIIEKEFLNEDPSVEDSVRRPKLAVTNKIPDMRRIRFVNNRDPGVTLEFHYGTGTHPLHRYKLIPGQEYDLPVEVIDHLESRVQPIYKDERDPDGFIKPVAYAYRNMFACQNTSSRAM